MQNDSFLKKFQGRTELIGREGILGIMNNVHINVNDYKLKPKKQSNNIRKKSSSKNEYINHSTEISKEFNKNKSNTPRLRNFSMSVKLPNNNGIIKNNIKNNNNNNLKDSIKNNKNDRKNIYISQKELNNKNDKRRISNTINLNNSGIKNKILEHKNKVEEKPIKLFKSFDQKSLNKNITPNKKNNQSLNYKKISPEIIKRDKNKNTNNLNINQSQNINKNNLNNNKLRTSKDIKLPKIVPLSAKHKNQNKNILYKNFNLDKSYDKLDSPTPDFKNNKRNKSYDTEKRGKSLKEALIKNNMINKKEKKNNSQENSFSLPKINSKEFNSNKNNNYFKIRINKKNINQNENNRVLNNIKNDFLLLDSIKNKKNNLYNQNLNERKYINNNINNNSKIINKRDKNKNKFNYENNYSNNNINRINYENNNNNSYNIDNNYEMNNINNNSYNINSMKDLNNYNNNIKNNNNIYKQYNRNNNIYNNVNNNRNYYNNESIFELNGVKKAHTSFDLPPLLPGLKEKLDIINEEDEEDNKYITDFNVKNSFSGGNLNTLEILMKQRMDFQNKIPNNSRFKLKKIEE